MKLLLYWQFGSLAVLDVLAFSDIAIVVYNTISNLFVRNLFKICYGISGPHISYWSVVGWSVVGALGRWSLLGDRLVGW